MEKNASILDKVSVDCSNDNETGFSTDIIPDCVKIVPERTKRFLSPEELSDYRDHRTEFLSWALWEGKNPEKKEGYSKSTIKSHAYRLNRYYRYVWEDEGQYTTDVTIEHAQRYIDLLKRADDSNEHKSQCVKALKILYRWMAHEKEGQKLEMKNPFSTGGNTNPKDYLTRKEREKIRQAAYEYGRIPTEGKTKKDIDELRTHLAQRFGKKKDELRIENLKSWKIPSMVEVSLDTGLRPCDFENASVEWVDLENNRITIPKRDSTKNTDNWEMVITESTAEVLEKWISEREDKELYQDTDALWLTRNGNYYNKNSLRDLMHNLFEKAEMRTEGRQASWYIIRHSTGTYLSEEKGLAHATAQLRHSSKDTTKEYIHPPVERRREGVEALH